ncbi:MAG: Type 1 glutamine amidotransferase-like domain-containing protein, partial [Pseudobdellovibrionaceae bacterium]
VCFIGTASGDAASYLDKFYNAYKTLNCEPTHLSLFKPPAQDLESFVLSKDLIHVGGGNTKNLLCLWKEWGLDKILLKASHQGVILSGMSAGMLCWFEEAITDSFGEKLGKLNGLGLLAGSACPHFDGESNRRPSYTQLIKDGGIQGGIALDDGAGALFIDGKLNSCVSSRSQARAFVFESKTAKEQILPIKFLG